MKRKQNICVWCGKRLWLWQRKVCSGTPGGHRIWCQTCSDLQRPPKSELRKWVESGITIFGMAAVLILFVLAVEYWDNL